VLELHQATADAHDQRQRAARERRVGIAGEDAGQELATEVEERLQATALAEPAPVDLAVAGANLA
jgi:hypothetical protein